MIDGLRGKATGHGPHATLAELWEYVRGNIKGQTPQLAGDLSLMIPLALRKTTQPAPPETPGLSQETKIQVELEFWKSAERSAKPNDYQAYLEKYPAGSFAALARARLEERIRRNPEQSAPSASTSVQVAMGDLEAVGRNAQGFDEYLGPTDGSVMVLIPGGSFLMGSDDGGLGEKPVHRVSVSPFLLDKHEVTVEKYRHFCHEEGHRFKDQPRWNEDDHPVVLVDWDDARAYCAWSGKRLPTEAEWEYAARGGTEGKKFPWGDKFDRSKTNIDKRGDGYKKTAPAGSFPRNGYGLHDMAGNVSEWCADWYYRNYYAESPKHDPQGPSSGRARVVRGGGWRDSEWYLHVADRGRFEPGDRFTSVGFRCARSHPD